MRGKLRIYLGAAPGVGKTYAMLDEGRRRRARGADVVIGLVSTHDRPRTMARIRDLEMVAPRSVTFRGETRDEVDVVAIMERRPQVVLIDEFACANAPGSANEHRWQDIDELITAGIDVISTVNIQHVESVCDIVNRITGVTERETVPDSAVRRADQIELVDMSPESLQRRMAHGNIYAPEAVGAALGNYFRLGNLGALRELALLWVADRVEDSLQDYMTQHNIADSWETRERVLVALTGAPNGGDLIRRAARMARRTRGDLIGAHVVRSDGSNHPEPAALAQQRRVLEELGGCWHRVVGADVPSTLVTFATAQHATQIVLGTSRRSRWTEFTQGSIVNRVVRAAEGIDVHVIADEAASSKRLRGHSMPIVRAYPGARLATAFALAAISVAVIGALAARGSALDPHHAGRVTSSAGLLMFLGVIVVIAAIGGRVPAIVTALAGIALVDWYLIPPYGSFAIARGSDAAYLATFVITALATVVAIEAAARRRIDASRSRSEADIVLALADRLIRPDPPQIVVDEIRRTLNRRAVALLAPAGGEWVVEAWAGEPSISSPADGEQYELRDGHVCVMIGTALHGDEQRLVAALLSLLDAMLAIDRLQQDASTVESLAHANQLRDALLAAVSHDLRTPLASIKALTSGWLEPDVVWQQADTVEFMRTIDAETDRLHKLVENLLDMSRLQSGALEPTRRPVGLDEIVPAALASLSTGVRPVAVDIPETLPLVDVDPALLERAVANLVDNALRHSGPGKAVRVEAAVVVDRIDLRVIDRGCGIPLAQRERVFRPFQRLGDTRSDTGVGLGLAVARGLVDAVGGNLTVEDTPGGGVTMVIGLPLAFAAENEVYAS